MTHLELVPAAAPAPAGERGQRLGMLRRRHRAWLAREAQVERVVRIVAPHLRDESRAEVPEGAVVWVQADRRWRAMVRVGGGL